MSAPSRLPPDEPSEGTPEPFTWTMLRDRCPHLWEAAARVAWKKHQRDYPEDAELERAHRIDKARGFDPRLPKSPTEHPAPWRRSGLKLPPYARDLPERLIRCRDLRIFIGRDAWRRAQEARKDSRHAITLLPPGEDPAAYDWGFAAGRVPLVVNAGAFPSEIEKLVTELFVADARTVVAIDQHGNLVVHEVSQS